MTTFDNRENAFEEKFAYDEKIGFAVEAKASKIFGLWAAEKLGLSGADAETYAGTVVSANLEEPGFDDVFRKVRADFDAKSIEVSDNVMHIEMKKAVDEATALIK